MKNAFRVALAAMAVAVTSCSGGAVAPAPTADTPASPTNSSTTMNVAQQSDARLASRVTDADVDSDAGAHAWLHSISAFNQSDVQAKLHFDDDGTTLRVLGIARGMDPTKAYVSLVYFTGSLSDGPQSGQCIPPPGNPLDSSHMLIAYWYPMTGSSVRFLYFAKTGPTSYVPLTSIATTSVRWDTTPQVQPVVANPTRLVLQACGAVVPRGMHWSQ